MTEDMLKKLMEHQKGTLPDVAGFQLLSVEDKQLTGAIDNDIDIAAGSIKALHEIQAASAGKKRECTSNLILA